MYLSEYIGDKFFGNKKSLLQVYPNAGKRLSRLCMCPIFKAGEV